MKKVSGTLTNAPAQGLSPPDVYKCFRIGWDALNQTGNYSAFLPASAEVAANAK